MAIIPIQTTDDQRISAYRDLSKEKLTRFSERFIAEGRWLVQRLLASGFVTESILSSERYVEEITKLVPAAIPVYAVPHSMVSDVVGFRFHRGILACALRPNNPELGEILRGEGKSTVVVCPEVVDPTNLGGIIRNCAAFGVDGVLVGCTGADPFSRRVVRVSMGAAFSLPIRTSDDVRNELCDLRTKHGYQLAATVMDEDAEPLTECLRPSRLALLFGGEGHGLDSELVRMCDRRITLPMRMRTDSLNVTSSTSVFLYHFTWLV